MLDEYYSSPRNRPLNTAVYKPYLSNDSPIPPSLSLTLPPLHVPTVCSQPSPEHSSAPQWLSHGPSTGPTTDTDTMDSSYSAPDHNRYDYFGPIAGGSAGAEPTRLLRLTKKQAASMTKDELNQWHVHRA